MAKLSKYQTLQKKMMSQTKPLFDLKDGKQLCEQLSRGYNEYLRFDRFESTSMDATWIKRIEECLPDLNDIVIDPKKTIQTFSEVVEVEKAKKTSAESVQHLASHTQYVKKVDDEGNITPSKILTIFNDDFYAIYENKFIATLIRRLFLFVEKRYEYIVNQATMRNVELLYFKNRTIIDGSEIEIETRVKYSKPTPESTEDKMKDFLKRIDDIRTYLRFFRNSEFMKILQRERDVRNPILQTNIIRKNPKYRKCFQLWQFLNGYMESGIEIKVEEKYSRLDAKELGELNKVLTMNFLALKGGDAPKQESKTRLYRPRILKTYDDEMWNPNVNYEGPVEFVRVDEKYRAFNEKLKNLDPHPTKALQTYLKEDYDENKIKKELTKENDALLKRKENEYKKYLKEQERLLKKEEEELEMISDLAEQQIQDEQEAALQPYRDALANKAQTDEYVPLDRSQIEEEPEEEPVVEEPVQEEEPIVEETPVEEPQEEPSKEEPVEEEEPIEEWDIEEKPEVEVLDKEEEPEEQPQPQPEPQPEPVEEAPKEEPVEEPKEEQPVAEEPVQEEPVKKQRGGARPGAGRPRKAVEEQPEPQPEEEQPQEKKQRGGARPGAGRPRKVVEEAPVEEEPVKKQRGGARPGAGRPRKVVEEPQPEEAKEEEPIAEEEPIIEEPVQEEPVIEEAPAEVIPEPEPEPEPQPELQPEPEPVEEEPKPKPVARPKPMSKKEERLARKAEREEKQARVLNVKSSRAGKKFGRKK